MANYYELRSVLFIVNRSSQLMRTPNPHGSLKNLMGVPLKVPSERSSVISCPARAIELGAAWCVPGCHSSNVCKQQKQFIEVQWSSLFSYCKSLTHCLAAWKVVNPTVTKTMHAAACKTAQFKEFLRQQAHSMHVKIKYLRSKSSQSNGGWVVRRTDTTCFGLETATICALELEQF